ncbi:unnamed protein product [Boreogadus saida]
MRQEKTFYFTGSVETMRTQEEERQELWVPGSNVHENYCEHRYDFVDQRTSSSGSGGSAAALQLSYGSTILFSVGAAGLPPSSPHRTSAEASAAIWQLQRGKLGGSPAAQLPEYNPFLLHVAVQYGLQRVNAKVPFPQFFSTMAEIITPTSLFLSWKYQRRQTQSL